MILTIVLSILSLFVSEGDDARIKALFMQNFMRNMEWPEGKSDVKYVIAVVGDVNLVQQIQELNNNRMINNRSVEAVNYTSEIALEDINILFLAKSLSDLYADFEKVAVPNSVLIVTEGKGMAEKGAAISFYQKGARLGIELNTKTLEASKIKASKTIINTAVLVN
jgi:hypothetical protein